GTAGSPDRPGPNRSGTHPHPRRVLLRYEVEAGVFVGAPPRCEPVKHTFAPEAGAPTIRGAGRVAVGAPPPVRTGQAHIRTRGGCSYDTRWWLVCCRSTAPGANRSGTHSHPRRVLLRCEVGAGVLEGHRPRCEPVRHTFAPEAGAPTIRGGGRCGCRSTAPGANRAGTHSHPRRVLLRYEVLA